MDTAIEARFRVSAKEIKEEKQEEDASEKRGKWKEGARSFSPAEPRAINLMPSIPPMPAPSLPSTIHIICFHHIASTQPRVDGKHKSIFSQITRAALVYTFATRSGEA
jgi:hypothetical protein